jgi:hypothetical protein
VPTTIRKCQNKETEVRNQRNMRKTEIAPQGTCPLGTRGEQTIATHDFVGKSKNKTSRGAFRHTLPSTLPPVKQEMPEATPHPFFNLQSLTPAPSPICPTQPPEPTSPMPTPEPGPSNPQQSGLSDKGAAPPSNWFNATDCHLMH